MDLPLSALVILLPLAASLLVLLARRWPRMAGAIGIFTALGVALLALWAARGGDSVAETWLVAGRSFELSQRVALFLVLLSLGLSVLFALQWGARRPQSVIAGGLAALAFLAAALMVEPFAFGAVFLLAATASVLPALYGGRYLAAGPSWRVFLAVALAVPLLVTANWLLDSGQSQGETVTGVLLLAALLLLGGFPFYVWVVGIARAASLPALALLLGVVGAGGALWLVQVIDQFPFVRGSTAFQAAIAGSALLSSWIAAFGLSRARAWPNWLAYGLVFDAGLQVATLLIPGVTSIVAMAAGSFGRLFALLLVVAAARGVAPEADVATRTEDGSWGSVAVGYGGLAILGLPLALSFVARWAALAALAGYSSLIAGLILLALGVAAVAVVRAARDNLIPPTDDRQAVGWGYVIPVALLFILVLFMGLFGPRLIEYWVTFVTG